MILFSYHLLLLFSFVIFIIIGQQTRNSKVNHCNLWCNIENSNKQETKFAFPLFVSLSLFLIFIILELEV